MKQTNYELYLKNAPIWAAKLKEGDTNYSLVKAREISPVFANLIEVELEKEDMIRKYLELTEQSKLPVLKEIKELIQLNTALVNLTTKLNVMAESYFSSDVYDAEIEEDIRNYMKSIENIGNYIDKRIWLIDKSFIRKGED